MSPCPLVPAMLCRVPAGSLWSFVISFACSMAPLFSLTFLSMADMRPIVRTLALMRLNFCSSCFFCSSSRSDIILLKSLTEDLRAYLISSCLTMEFILSRLSIISPILSIRKGSDQEIRSSWPGRWNGYSTSLYCLMFILSFSIKITAPLFLYDPQ